MQLNRSAGAASLLMIFAAAVLCVFTVLAMSTANSDYSLSKKSAQSTQTYYAAYGECSHAAAYLAEHIDGDSGADDIAAALSEYGGVYDIQRSGEGVTCRLDIDGARYFLLTLTPDETGARMTRLVCSSAADDPSLWEGDDLSLWDGE